MQYFSSIHNYLFATSKTVIKFKRLSMHMKWYTNNDVFHFYDMCVLMARLKETFLFFYVILFQIQYMVWYSWIGTSPTTKVTFENQKER